MQNATIVLGQENLICAGVSGPALWLNWGQRSPYLSPRAFKIQDWILLESSTNHHDISDISCCGFGYSLCFHPCRCGNAALWLSSVSMCMHVVHMDSVLITISLYLWQNFSPLAVEVPKYFLSVWKLFS